MTFSAPHPGRAALSTPPPGVVGFELPGADAGEHDAIDQVLSVLLDRAPSPEWLEALARQGPAFMRLHALSDLRAVGCQLNVVGRRAAVRKLTGPVRELVEQLGRGDEGTRRSGGRAPAQPPPASEPDVQRWVDPRLVRAIPRIPQILEEISALTGMRFTAMSRVDDVRWTALALYDGVAFGMAPGQELTLEATICGEVRLSQDTIAFGNASDDPVYACHPLPSMYGFQSYISMPIFTADGAVFGTVCALDPEPRALDAAMLDGMREHARWLGTQLPALID